MNLLLFNLVTDIADPILGFTTRWIDALSERVDHIDVITMRAGVVRTPRNVVVHSVGKERGLNEVRRGVEFYRLLRAVLAERHIDACFSHMMPLFSVMAAPLLRRRRIPIVTWYTHRQLSTVLRLAYAVSSRVVTASPDSWPYLREKLVVVGHGIDTDLFSPIAATRSESPLIVSVGRIAPIKNTHLLVDAVRLLHDRGVPVRCFLVGATLDHDREYGSAMTRRIRELGLESAVRFVGPVPHDDVVAHHRAATVHVSLSPQGLFDKAVLESMACGAPGVVAHHGYDELLGDLGPSLRVGVVTALGVSDTVSALLAKPEPERLAIGARLRAAVVARHGLATLSDRIVALLKQLADDGGGRLAA